MLGGYCSKWSYGTGSWKAEVEKLTGIGLSNPFPSHTGAQGGVVPLRALALNVAPALPPRRSNSRPGRSHCQAVLPHTGPESDLRCTAVNAEAVLASGELPRTDIEVSEISIGAIHPQTSFS